MAEGEEEGMTEVEEGVSEEEGGAEIEGNRRWGKLCLRTYG